MPSHTVTTDTSERFGIDASTKSAPAAATSAHTNVTSAIDELRDLVRRPPSRSPSRHRRRPPRCPSPTASASIVLCTKIGPTREDRPHRGERDRRCRRSSPTRSSPHAGSAVRRRCRATCAKDRTCHASARSGPGSRCRSPSRPRRRTSRHRGAAAASWATPRGRARAPRARWRTPQAQRRSPPPAATVAYVLTSPIEFAFASWRRGTRFGSDASRAGVHRSERHSIANDSRKIAHSSCDEGHRGVHHAAPDVGQRS